MKKAKTGCFCANKNVHFQNGHLPAVVMRELVKELLGVLKDDLPVDIGRHNPSMGTICGSPKVFRCFPETL